MLLRASMFRENSCLSNGDSKIHYLTCWVWEEEQKEGGRGGRGRGRRRRRRIYENEACGWLLDSKVARHKCIIMVQNNGKCNACIVTVITVCIYVAGQNEIQVKMKFLGLLTLIIHRS